jgi:hypothetical protein
VDPDFDLKCVDGEVLVDPYFDLKCVEGMVEEGRLATHFDERQGEVQVVDSDFDPKGVEGEVLVDPYFDLKCVEVVVEEGHLATHFDERQGEAVDLEEVVQVFDSDFDLKCVEGEVLVDLDFELKCVEGVEGAVEEVLLAMYFDEGQGEVVEGRTTFVER